MVKKDEVTMEAVVEELRIEKLALIDLKERFNILHECTNKVSKRINKKVIKQEDVEIVRKHLKSALSKI